MLGSSSNKRICVLVLGMHRSGTSALARTLSIAGLSLPATLLGTSEWNVTGHWEPARLVAYHDAILEELGSSWKDWRPLALDQIPKARKDEMRAQILKILGEDYGRASCFVLKDPRICRFAPFLIETLSSDGIDVRVAMITRNPLEVCESLERRNGMTKAHAGLLWLRHTLDGEAATRSLRRAVVSYDALLTDWEACLGRLSEQLHVSWPKREADIASHVDRFLSKDLRHHERSMEDVVVDPVLKDWAGETYRALLMLESDPKDEKATARLDALRRKFGGLTDPAQVDGAQAVQVGHTVRPSQERAVAGDAASKETWPSASDGAEMPSSPLTIVAGISSSGKSTYVDEIAGGRGLLASDVSCVSQIPDNGILHYNTLRYADNDPTRVQESYFADRLLSSIMRSQRAVSVVYLIATGASF